MELAPEILELFKCLGEKARSDSQAVEIHLSRLDQEEVLWKVYVKDSGDSGRIFSLPLAKQSRLRVLNAIGSCRTLRRFSVQGTLTIEELEALLTPMQSNSVLERIYLLESYPDSFLIDSEEATDQELINAAERVWMLLGNILGTSRTLRELHLEFARLSDAVVQKFAEALQGNSNSTLEKLSLSRLGRPSVAKHAAEIVLAAPKLSQLTLQETGVLGDDGIKALSNAVVQKTYLESLGLEDVESGGSAFLLQSLAGKGCNKSITSLQLYGNIDGLGECLPIIMSSNQTLKSVELYSFQRAHMSPTESQKLGQALCSNTSLTQFSIAFQWSYISTEGIDSLREILGGINGKNPIVKLHISTWRRREFDELSGSSSVSDVIVSNIASIRMLLLDLDSAGRERVSQVKNILEALQSNSTVIELKVLKARGRLWSMAWKKLFLSLRYNTAITDLDLSNCDGLGDDEFRDLMGILQVNMTLKRLTLTASSWEKDGKAALIQEALNRNAKQQSYFSILAGSGLKLEFEAAKGGRLFLCGSPRAGKTRLRQTLIRIVRGRSWFGDKLAELLRTTGIEVEMLRDDQDMQIAVWDLGGHKIFRTLQDILFPRTNQTFIFVFVFSVYDEVRGCIKEHLDESLKTELEEWLRFIASNIQVTGTTLPKVVVVISHMDKMKVRSTEWAEFVVERLRLDFQEVLDLCNSQKMYRMDSRKKKEVAPLKDFIFDTFGELLQNKSPIVPKVCSGLNLALSKRKKHFRHRPLWRSEDFYQFCQKSLKEDSIPFPTQEIQNDSKVLEAMASYLHDTGSIVQIPNLEWIVVDPNWLTNVFLGDLITIGQNFQVNNDAFSTGGASFHSRDGFVSSFELHQLLSAFILKHPKVKELNEKFLIDILIQLDLCYKVDGVHPKYFIPTIVPENPVFGGPHEGQGQDGKNVHGVGPIRKIKSLLGYACSSKIPEE